MNVSSIVVKTAPQYRDDLIASINSLDLCQVYFSDESGRIIVTIEGETIEMEMEKLQLIQSIPHVFSADLMYSYSEDELSDAMEHIRNLKDSVPESLK